MESVSPGLFINDDGEPLEFSIRGLSSESSIIVHLIKKGGGMIHVKRDGPHTILLDKPESRIFGEEEFFSCQYIPECCEANSLLDLNKYRLNKNSKYVKDYDANLVLLKKKSWKDIPLESNELSDAEKDNEIEPSGIMDELPRSSRTLKTVPRPYTEKERVAIINWIIKNKYYSSVGGNSLWMQMEEEQVPGLTAVETDSLFGGVEYPSRRLLLPWSALCLLDTDGCSDARLEGLRHSQSVCEGRSWQSMKEHFKKKILPSINKFGLSEKHVKYFKTRRPFCE